LSQLLARLATRETRLAEAEQLVAESQARLDALLEYNRQAEARWDRLNQSAEAEARREAREIVANTRKETEKLVAEIRRRGADSGVVKEAHRTLARLAQAAREKPRPTTNEVNDLRTGQKVMVRGIRTPGEITAVQEDGRRVTVLIGSMHYTVARAEVQSIVPEPEAAPPSEVVPVGAPPAAEVYEIDLRGQAVDEAKLELTDTLEAIREQGILDVRVIHGGGTGVLRRELRSWFRAHAAVSSFRRGGPGEGGDGVTVLTLKAP
jgi:DNA mismatch repair protein MutS2